VLEAIQMAEEMCGQELHYSVSEGARQGDHIWWISDVRKFQNDYPEWQYHYDIKRILKEIVESVSERFTPGADS
jgi:CDP-paratose 2-epimerase